MVATRIKCECINKGRQQKFERKKNYNNSCLFCAKVMQCLRFLFSLKIPCHAFHAYLNWVYALFPIPHFSFCCVFFSVLVGAIIFCFVYINIVLALYVYAVCCVSVYYLISCLLFSFFSIRFPNLFVFFLSYIHFIYILIWYFICRPTIAYECFRNLCKMKTILHAISVGLVEVLVAWYNRSYHLFPWKAAHIKKCRW